MAFTTVHAGPKRWLLHGAAPLLLVLTNDFLVASGSGVSTSRCSHRGSSAACLAGSDREEDLRWSLNDGVSLMERSRRKSRTFLDTNREQVASDGSTCVPLTNKGSHFTVDVLVGTPPQGPFSVVADTGSNSAIVQSCACGETGQCTVAKDGHCFRGTGQSSTFSLFTEAGEVTPSDGVEMADPLVVEMAFGSGTIAGLIAKDVLRVGDRSVTMKDGLLLMIAQQLEIPGPTIEGILGLGLPMRNQSTLQPAEGKNLTVPKVLGFLEQANIDRFSMCFNSNADGVLRLDTPVAAEPLGSIGEEHWGLGIEGISAVGVGGTVVASMASKLCSPEDMKPGQETPCGAIPDSGTTMITGPKTYIMAIQASLCEAWPSCKAKAEEKDFPDHPGVSDEAANMIVKSAAFETLLLDCASWMNSTEAGAAMLPVLQFQITGKGGKKQTVSLPGSAYVFEAQKEEVEIKYMDTWFGKLPVKTTTGKMKAVCVSAFMPMEYNTEKNGPVFIFGLPLFYQYVVDYDLGTKPPSIAITSKKDKPCGSCDAASPELGLPQIGVGHRLHRLLGPVRGPHIDTSRPL